MTKAEIKAHWAIPDETLGDGYTLTHKRERETYVKGYHQALADVCEWLGSGRIWQYITYDKEADTIYMTGNLYEDLKQAMEE